VRCFQFCQYLHQNLSPPRHSIRKITIAVAVAPKYTGDLKLLPPKLHNALKSPIKRTILALGRINASPHNQRMA
jgi:hypothetical protein